MKVGPNCGSFRVRWGVLRPTARIHHGSISLAMKSANIAGILGRPGVLEALSGDRAEFHSHASIGTTAGNSSWLAEVCRCLHGMIGAVQVKASSAMMLQSFCVQLAADHRVGVSPLSALAKYWHVHQA